MPSTPTGYYEKKIYSKAYYYTGYFCSSIMVREGLVGWQMTSAHTFKGKIFIMPIYNKQTQAHIYNHYQPLKKKYLIISLLNFGHTVILFNRVKKMYQTIQAIRDTCTFCTCSKLIWLSCKNLTNSTGTSEYTCKSLAWLVSDPTSTVTKYVITLYIMQLSTF